MKILSFAASTSTKSINRQLLMHAARRISDGVIPNSEVELLDLNEYEMPIYSQDREAAGGIPEPAQQLFAKIGAADAVLISFAEHNGSYTAAFKNIYDWMSRIDSKVYQGRPVVLLAASPGPGGGRNVLATATSAAPHFGAELKAQLSVPRFHQNFDTEQGLLTDSELSQQLDMTLKALAD